MLGRIIYGAVFVILLPVLLAAWAYAAEPNVTLPAYGNAALGWVSAFGGLGLLATGMWNLWHLGGGLPMNAYPPPRLVTGGAFRWLPHPIYTGFVLMCAGVSMVAASRSGFWLVTPTALLACVALVFGYERLDLRHRFGDMLHIFPPEDAARTRVADWIRYYLYAVIPWVVLYSFTVSMHLPGRALRFEFEGSLPIFVPAIIVYEGLYVAVGLAPWIAETRSALRRLMISLWVSMTLVFPFYWICPSTAPRRPLDGSAWLAHVLLAERSFYPPTAAFPSFHVLWAILLARLIRPRWLGVLFAVAVAVSCVATGMHYISDVIASALLAPLLLEPERIWKRVLAAVERIANSWREWRLGPVRIINHGVYAGAAALVHVALVTAATGPASTAEVAVTAFAGLAGAGAWAQWVEGSSRLRRPFGFYGALIGVALACLFFDDRWILLGAHALAAPWTQAIGRLRCLVNGCCHGSPAPPEFGIRVTHTRSRVTRLAGLSGRPIHATQLYSILGNVLAGLILAKLWSAGCPLLLVCGVYAIANGCVRFVEEAYRGEPQTPRVWGLRLYQWIATGTVIAGVCLSSWHSIAAPALTFSGAGLASAAAFALIAAIALGVDFPESDLPLARLT